MNNHPATPFYARGKFSGSTYLVLNQHEGPFECDYDVLRMDFIETGIYFEHTHNLEPISGTLTVGDNGFEWTDLPEPEPEFPKFPFYARGGWSGVPFLVTGPGYTDKHLSAVYLAPNLCIQPGTKTDGLARDLIDVIPDPFAT